MNFSFQKGVLSESRDVICADKEGNIRANESFCDADRYPELSKECEDQEEELCENFWLATGKYCH